MCNPVRPDSAVLANDCSQVVPGNGVSGLNSGGDRLQTLGTDLDGYGNGIANAAGFVPLGMERGSGPAMNRSAYVFPGPGVTCNGAVCDGMVTLTILPRSSNLELPSMSASTLLMTRTVSCFHLN